MCRISLRAILLLALILSSWNSWSPRSAHAASEAQELPFYVGGLLGLSSVSDDIGTGIAYGVNAGYIFFRPWGIGAVVRGGNHDQGITSFLIAGELLYEGLLVPGLAVALDIGSAKFSGAGYPGEMEFAAGARVGMDFAPLAEQAVTVGGEAGLLFSEPGSTFVQMFHLLASVKVRF